MKESAYNNNLVEQISKFLQDYMIKNNVEKLSADQCADLLAERKILDNKVGPKPGYNFRQVLRDGRDGKINMVKGVFQERPKTKWHINRV
ncbi:hypothetical protein [Flavobacterium litorale]|uniref:Uncharacterized protein n=1 Tax=Flavobacterium litorale TaxID=2856519 RepID=A0ABX8V942_9FLAO|nr:hypothetical protein [Flavobacterium litorale]QYJ69363.1 hypothetical protein K1I41_05600 [Flavobacterium litorale]